jgi:hypothetical protein
MAISATSSASDLMRTIRSQYQEQFAKLKQAYQETGTVVGAEAAYQSDDGNLKISVRGFQTPDGKQAVDVTYAVDGAESATLQLALGYGIDNDTGLARPSDIRYGNIGMSASDYVDDAGDFDALAKRFADLNLETQDESNAKIRSWGYGEKTFASLDEYRAYMRVEFAASRAVNEMADKMKFKSGQDSVDFVISTSKALAAAMHRGGNVDLSSILKDVPLEALKAATRPDSTNPESQKVIKLLTDFIDANKKQLAEQTPNQLFEPRRANLLA